MTSDYLTCKELTELVTDYVEGALPRRDRERFEEHMMTCPPCQGYLEQMRHTIALLGRLPEDTIPPEAEQVLLEAFRSWKSN